MRPLVELLAGRDLVLASASPRRLQLLEQLGLMPRVIASDVAEYQAADFPADFAALVCANAQLKGDAVAELLDDSLVIAADTVVALEAQVMGKPADAAQAAAMLRLLSGRWHTVYSGLYCRDCGSGRALSAASASQVRFAEISEAEIAAYVASGEPLDKAGAYGIQGLGGQFVAEIQGDYGTVVGLSLSLLRQMLQELLAE